MVSLFAMFRATLLVAFLSASSAFTVMSPQVMKLASRSFTPSHSPQAATLQVPVSSTGLFMSDAGTAGQVEEKKKEAVKEDSEFMDEAQIDLGVTMDDEREMEMDPDDENWRVVLHDDQINTIPYVVDALDECVDIIDDIVALSITMYVHENGKATVCKCWKQKGEEYCLALQRKGLTVSLAPETDFEDGDEVG
eukprot:Nitzschia sp. Nitz4//scaffold56_size114212//66092//66673//NITZ4_003954-RA/size114212-processed-gene-0.67-mRNA-1//-1//CDS//3329554718//2889//frame0